MGSGTNKYNMDNMNEDIEDLYGPFILRINALANDLETAGLAEESAAAHDIFVRMVDKLYMQKHGLDLAKLRRGGEEANNQTR